MNAFDSYKLAVMDLLTNCAPSNGVVDMQAWDKIGCPNVFSPKMSSCLKAPEIRRLTFAERIAKKQWGFASTPGGVENLEAGHCAVEALHWLGELETLDSKTKQDWADHLNSFHDKETGYFIGPYIQPKTHPSWNDTKIIHTWAHMQDHLLSCLAPTLRLLGAKPKWKLSEGSMSGRFLDREYLRSFLEGRNWQSHNPWWMGNEFWYPGCVLWQISVDEAGTSAGKLARQLLDEEWYGWHDRNMNHIGFWHGDLDQPAKQWHGKLIFGSTPKTFQTRDEYHWSAVQVMGGAHQLWLYDYDGHSIDSKKRQSQTDILLSLQHASGHFGLEGPEHDWSDDCTDVDCTTLLGYNFRRQDYRRKDILLALERAGIAILRDKMGQDGLLRAQINNPYSHHAYSTDTYSPVGAPNLLQQSFYLWSVVVACSVVKKSQNSTFDSFCQHIWRDPPSHWLWVGLSEAK